MKSKVFFLIPALLLAAFGAGFSATAGETAADSADGLQLVATDRRGAIYANPDVDWSMYTEIRLLDATVAFRRHWQRDQNRTDPFKVRAEDMEEIKQSMAESIRDVFSEELTRDNGYRLTAGAGEHVLTIKPAIVDLDLAAPDTIRFASSHQYAERAGRMTLKLELYDSLTGALLATATDHREAPREAFFRRMNSASNRAEMQRIMHRWAEGLRERLDEARRDRTVPATI